MKLSLPLLLLTAVLFFSCQRELDPSILQEPEENNTIIAAENEKLKKAITTQTREVYLAGYIKDEAGKPVAQAKIQAGGKETQTDAEGYFNFKKLLTVNRDYALVTVTKNGYMNGFKTFTPNKKNGISHSIELVLQTKSTAKTFTASSGGSITIDDKIKLDFPANSIVTKSGQPYNGNVQVIGRYIDPAAETFLETMPGTLSGLNLNGQIRAMESYGMASIDLYDASGNELEIAAEQNVTMKMPASAGSPATIPLWHFNERFGIWIQTGTAKKEGSEYIATVNHFSVWNLDAELNSYELQLQFVTGDSSFPLSSVLVQVTNETTGAKYGSVRADAHGKATLINCPGDAPLKLTLALPCGPIEKVIAPVTASRTETVRMDNVRPELLSFSLNGTLYGCNNDTLKNQPFEIRLNNGVLRSFHGTTDSSGHYEISVILCKTGNPIQARTYAYINEQLKFSASGELEEGNYTYLPTVCDGINTGTIINEDDEVVFPDGKLEARIRTQINKPTGAIMLRDVKGITTLDIMNAQVTSLEGLQYLIALSELKAGGNQIAQFSPLQYLTNLKLFYIYGNSFENNQLNFLTGLTNLKSLSIFGNNKISDISMLSTLTNLNTLSISLTSVTDISVLASLKSLTQLDIKSNQISDLTPIENLTNLTHLWMDSVKGITNLKVVKNLTNLLVFHASRNKITDISDIANCKKLFFLNLGYNKIQDLSPLSNINSLDYITVMHNDISSITPIMKSFPLLREFFITNGNAVPPAQITNFKTLNPNCTVN